MNSRPLDQRFLRVHPRTAIWFEQRKQCERCEHCIEMPAVRYGNHAKGGGGLRCAAVKEQPYCIDMRDADDSTCGPEARLFKEKT